MFRTQNQEARLALTLPLDGHERATATIGNDVTDEIEGIALGRIIGKSQSQLGILGKTVL